MAAQRKHKKIDRAGVLPRQLTGDSQGPCIPALPFCTHSAGQRAGRRRVRRLFWGPGGLFYPVFPIRDRNEPGGFQPDPYKNRTLRNHRRKKIAGQALLTAFFVSVVLALFGRCLKRCAVRLILCVALCKNGVFGVIMCARYPDAVLDAARHSGCLWQAGNSGQMDTRIRSTFIFRSAPDCSTARRIRSEGRRAFAEYILSGGIWCARSSVFRFMRQSFVHGRLRDLLDKGFP